MLENGDAFVEARNLAAPLSGGATTQHEVCNDPSFSLIFSILFA